MQNNWEPRVGQRVVRTGETLPGFVEKGKTYIVSHLTTCSGCKRHFISLEEVAMPAIGKDRRCRECESPVQMKPFYYFPVSKFAPINEYPDQTAEIAKLFREHPDTVDQPVKVLETVN